MVTVEQIEERRREWGEDSALYIASVLGRFPDNLEDAIVPRSLLMEAVERQLEPEGEATLACDVARFGADKTVVYRRQGNVCRLVWKSQGRDTQQVAGHLKAMAEDDPEVGQIIVDDTGVGGGVTDRLNEEGVAGGGSGSSRSTAGRRPGGLTDTSTPSPRHGWNWAKPSGTG
jgi:hypothetical protein